MKKSKEPIFVQSIRTLCAALMLILLFVVLPSLLVLGSARPTCFAPKRSILIPKKIWTFWHKKELPDFYRKCVASWTYWNPEYEIVVLRPETIGRYIDSRILLTPPFDKDVRLLSDIVRLRVLSKYGGVWMDTSIICSNENLDWFLRESVDRDAEYVGYFADRFTQPRYRVDSPIIESWMFACVPNSPMVVAWLAEFEKIQNQPVESYVTQLQHTDSIATQRIQPNSIVYLVVYMSLQKVLQQNPGKYRFHVIPSDRSAMVYLENNNWNREEAIDDLVENAAAYCRDQNILKICKEERLLLLKKNYDVLFVT